MGCWHGGDEKLWPIGIGTSVGHGQDAGCVMVQTKLLILKLVTIYRVTSVAITSLEISALYHEPGNNSVHFGSFVSKTRLPCTQLTEIFCGSWHNIIKQFNLNSAHFFTISTDLKINFWPFLFPLNTKYWTRFIKIVILPHEFPISVQSQFQVVCYCSLRLRLGHMTTAWPQSTLGHTGTHWDQGPAGLHQCQCQ